MRASSSSLSLSASPSPSSARLALVQLSLSITSPLPVHLEDLALTLSPVPSPPLSTPRLPLPLDLSSASPRLGPAVLTHSDLARFIAAGRLSCTIDRVASIVETHRPDAKNARYAAVIKQGDAVLTSVQRLSRVIG